MYTKPGISIILSSDVEFPDLVAEIYYDAGLVAVIRKDARSGTYLAEYLPHDKGRERFVGAVPLEALMDAIAQAKRELA
jgi:hypothetical protein